MKCNIIFTYIFFISHITTNFYFFHYCTNNVPNQSHFLFLFFLSFLFVSVFPRKNNISSYNPFAQNTYCGWKRAASEYRASPLQPPTRIATAHPLSILLVHCSVHFLDNDQPINTLTYHITRFLCVCSSLQIKTREKN